MSETLFEGYDPPPAPPSAAPDLSADRRRTMRQTELIAAGIHPLTKRKIHDLASRHRDAASPKTDPFTCGSCYFRVVSQHHDYSYPKCFLPGPTASADKPTYPRVSHGASSDVRAWWPACPDYSPGDRALSPDAARSLPNL